MIFALYKILFQIGKEKNDKSFLKRKSEIQEGAGTEIKKMWPARAIVRKMQV